MSDVLAINGSTINLATYNASLDMLIPHVKGGLPELHLSRLLGPLTTLPDAWSGKPVTLTMGGTLVFAGDVVGYLDRFMDPVGWVREYRALGLLNRAAYIPVTDATSLTDTSTWNLPGDDPAFVASRAGRTTGQVVASILTMAQNATALANAGIGAYTSFAPPTLPPATQADLAALTVIPPWRVTISGERILQALEAFVQSVHPNHYLHVQPDGTIRFLDSRSFSPNTLTLGADPRLDMPSLTRDYSDCYSQVEVRGNTLVRGVTLQTSPWPGSANSDGGLVEDFAWGAFSNATAKSNWTPACWNQPLSNGQASETGTCTCPDTTHVTCAVSGTYVANYWDQSATGVLGWIVLYADSLNGQLHQHVQARVIASTATSGGHITVTLDTALPTTAYNAYQLWGLTQNCALVGRKYLVSNAAIRQALQQFFPYPVPFINDNGMAAEMTTSPVAEIIYNGNTATDLLQIDPVNGIIYFSRPTQTIYGMPQWPDNVRVFVPVAYGTLAAYAPCPIGNSTVPNGYAGTLYTVEGIQRTKIITALDWKDYSNQQNMGTFAAEFLDSVKDVVVEGVVPYHGLLSAYLAPGQAVSIAGTSGGTPYTTGWESLALPVVSVELRFQTGPEGTSYHTTLHVSNRRGRYSAENFLRPSITGSAFGTDEVFSAGPTMVANTLAFTPENTGTMAPQVGGLKQIFGEAAGGLSGMYQGAAGGLNAMYADTAQGMRDIASTPMPQQIAQAGLSQIYAGAAGDLAGLDQLLGNG
jgi:hypothetical protein